MVQQWQLDDRLISPIVMLTIRRNHHHDHHHHHHHHTMDGPKMPQYTFDDSSDYQFAIIVQKIIQANALN